jgi:hypothetical protein
MDKIITEKAYIIVVGAVVSLVTGTLVKKGWSLATGGQEPPNPNDPDVPAKQAIAWLVASTVAAGVTQLLVSRHAKSFINRRRSTSA